MSRFYLRVTKWCAREQLATAWLICSLVVTLFLLVNFGW